MTNFNINPNMVRVDIFKPSNKWVETIAIEMKSYNGFIHDSFEEALYEAIEERYKGCLAVCLEPYHEHSHPLCHLIK